MDKLHGLLMFGIVASVVCNAYFYSYWYDHEYLHGEKGIWASKIIFSQDYYGIIDYVMIGKQSYEWGDFDVRDKIYAELDQWNFSYNVTVDDDPYFIRETITITDHREPCFDISFHTYDAPMECSYDTYKQKVVDSLNIGATLSSS